MKKFLLLPLILLLLLPSVHAGSNYIILRANVNPMYIEGESIQIQAFILVFHANKPTDESAILKVSIQGIDINYNYNEEITIRGGRKSTFNLVSLKEGHYKITIYAKKGSLRSQIMTFEFGVTKAPVPYSISFSPGGKKVYFKSLKLNENGTIDTNYPFTLYVNSFIHGEGEVLIKTIRNATNISFSIPETAKHGVVTVDVVDCFGWKNSATMDLSSFSFTGYPISFDYDYRLREPFKSRTLLHIAITIITILLCVVAFVVIGRYYYG